MLLFISCSLGAPFYTPPLGHALKRGPYFPELLFSGPCIVPLVHCSVGKYGQRSDKPKGNER